jgi:hypothetical protein
VGVVAGAAATAAYASAKHWTIVVPTVAWAGGFGAAILIGAIAGLLPLCAPPDYHRRKRSGVSNGRDASGLGQPQMSAAVSTISRSFATSSS